MNLQRFWYIVSVLGIIGLVFYLGYLFGTRENFNSKTDSVEITSPNGAQKNFLSEIEQRIVVGPLDSKTINTFGELLFIQSQSNQTQILLRLQNVPNTVKQTDSKKEKAIPKELNVVVARLMSDGLDYQYTTIGKIVLDDSKSNQRSGKFSTTIQEVLFNERGNSVARIELQPTKPEDANIFTDDSADLPVKVRQRPAPFFWVKI
jgi:hypothetical protein